MGSEVGLLSSETRKTDMTEAVLAVPIVLVAWLSSSDSFIPSRRESKWVMQSQNYRHVCYTHPPPALLLLTILSLNTLSLRAPGYRWLDRSVWYPRWFSSDNTGTGALNDLLGLFNVKVLRSPNAGPTGAQMTSSVGLMNQWVATNSSRILMSSVLDIGVIKSVQISTKLYSKKEVDRWGQ